MDLNETEGMKIVDVPMNDIFCDNNFNCRGPIMPIDVISLANSIKAIGLQAPIIIHDYKGIPGKKYRIISGHRRYTAFKVNEAKSIPAIIRPEMNELQARKLNLEENLKRKDLNIVQEAKAIEHFARAGWTMKEIGSQLTEPVHWVDVRLKLLKLPADIQETAAAGFLTQEHIKALAKLSKNPDAMYAAVRKIKESKLAGERKKIEVTKKKIKPFAKHARSRAEIYTLLSTIQETVGNGFFTRVLAWAAGEISDFDIHRDLKDFAGEKGVIYNLPEEFLHELANV